MNSKGSFVVFMTEKKYAVKRQALTNSFTQSAKSPTLPTSCSEIFYRFRHRFSPRLRQEDVE